MVWILFVVWVIWCSGRSGGLNDYGGLGDLEGLGNSDYLDGLVIFCGLRDLVFWVIYEILVILVVWVIWGFGWSW